MTNPNPGNQFKPGDPRINRKGRPKSDGYGKLDRQIKILMENVSKGDPAAISKRDEILGRIIGAKNLSHMISELQAK